MPRIIDAEKLVPKHYVQRTDKIIGYEGTQPIYEYTDIVAYDIDNAPTVEAIPVDYIWDRAEFYEKQWLEDDNHWAKNVAEALRALLEDWDGEVGGILERYEGK